MAVLSFLLSPVGRWLAGGLAILAVLGLIYAKGYNDGSARIQAKWDAAVQAAIDKGNTARTDATGDVERDPDGGLRDNYNRDK